MWVKDTYWPMLITSVMMIESVVFFVYVLPSEGTEPKQYNSVLYVKLINLVCSTEIHRHLNYRIYTIYSQTFILPVPLSMPRLEYGTTGPCDNSQRFLKMWAN